MSDHHHYENLHNSEQLSNQGMQSFEDGLRDIARDIWQHTVKPGVISLFSGKDAHQAAYLAGTAALARTAADSIMEVY